MTLPPNSLPVENAALSGDLLALLGQPASASGVEGQPAAPFSEILASAGLPATTSTLPQMPAAPASLLEAMYSNRCYTTILQSEVGGAESAAEGVAENISVEDPATVTEAPVTEDEGVLLLAYQLLAGQWVPQPPVAVEQPAKPTSETELDPAFLPECGGRKTDFAPVDSVPDKTSQPAEKPNQAVAPVFSEAEKIPASAKTLTPAEPPKARAALRKTEVAEKPATPLPEIPAVTSNARSDATVLPDQAETAILPEHTKTVIMAEPAKTVVLPDQAKTAILPEHTKTVIMAEPAKTVVLPAQAKTAILPEYTKTVIMAEAAKTVVLPDQAETAILPEHTKTAIMSEPAKTVVLPAQAKTAILPEYTKTVIMAEPAKTVVLPDQAKTAILPEQGKTPIQNNAPATTEKFAAPGFFPPVESASGVNSPKQPSEKKTLVVDGKAQKASARQIGTPAANREYAMSSSAANKPPALPLQSLPQVVQVGGIQQGTTQAVVESGTATAAQAPRLVQEIHAIAERICNIDRNTVEVRFDFNEADRLSVRVEYRDGVVHTVFRTDSDTLRAAIAREWQVQAPVAEQRAYRVAEPTFSTNSDASSVDLSQSGLGSGHSQSRTFEPGAPAFHGFAHSGRSTGKTTTETPESSNPAFRPETSRRLHTFA